MSALAVEPESEPSLPVGGTAWSPLLLLVVASGWAVTSRTVPNGVEVTARKNGVVIRAVAATVDDTAVTVFQQAMTHRGRT